MVNTVLLLLAIGCVGVCRAVKFCWKHEVWNSTGFDDHC